MCLVLISVLSCRCCSFYLFSFFKNFSFSFYFSIIFFFLLLLLPPNSVFAVFACWFLGIIDFQSIFSVVDFFVYLNVFYVLLSADFLMHSNISMTHMCEHTQGYRYIYIYLHTDWVKENHAEKERKQQRIPFNLIIYLMVCPIVFSRNCLLNVKG